MIVKVDIPAESLWKLSVVAEKRGMNVATMLAELAEKLLADRAPAEYRPRPSMRGVKVPRYPTDVLLAKVKELHGKGYNDAQAAELIGCAAETVRIKRNLLGLPANGRVRAADIEFMDSEAS